MKIHPTVTELMMYCLVAAIGVCVFAIGYPLWTGYSSLAVALCGIGVWLAGHALYALGYIVVDWFQHRRHLSL